MKLIIPCAGRPPDNAPLLAADACVRITEPHTLTLLSGIRFYGTAVWPSATMSAACSPPGLAG
jgi:hypothetical protein